MSATTVSVGDRIRVKDAFATVRYVGEVPPTTGEWLGVEWDDHNRGKHSGDHEGVSYFEVAVEGSASFVRAKKLDPTVSLLDAIRDRYTPTEPSITEDLFVVSDGTRRRRVDVSLVGEEKALAATADLSRIERLCLDGRNIDRLADAAPSSSGGPSAAAEILGAMLPRATELDLSRNLISSWDVVADMVAALPSLEGLILSLNRLRPLNGGNGGDGGSEGGSVGGDDGIEEAVWSGGAPLDRLRSLVLHSTLISMADVITVVGFTPNLVELHLGKNNIPHLDFGAAALPALEVADLSFNAVGNWDEVLTLAVAAPSLRVLLVHNNLIGEVVIPEGMLSDLERLSIGNNLLDAWPSIDAIATLPKLTELRLHSVPLAEATDPHEAFRGLVVARMPGLRQFNGGTPISAQERMYAERLWLRRGDGYDEATASAATKSLWAELMARHGPQRQAPTTHTLKDSLLVLHLVDATGGAGHCATKKMPAKMTVAKVKLLARRLLRLPKGDDLVLVAMPPDAPGPSRAEPAADGSSAEEGAASDWVENETILDDDMRTLGFYNVRTDSTLEVRSAC